MGAMDKDDFKLYLQNIEEYVLDENKIVSYKWLSKNLGIHVNTAKQLLYSFTREQKDKVHSTYLVGGLLKNGNGGSVKIVREEDLEKVKDEYKLITSEHVYSIQKAKKVQDLNALYAVDVKSKGSTEESNVLGSIKCGFEVLRPQEEVTGLKQKARAAADVGNDKKWPTAKKPIEVSSSKVESSAATSAEGCENGETKQGPKKTGIAAMFAAQNSKPRKEETAETKSKPISSKQKPGSGISMFFSRQTEKSKQNSSQKNNSGVSSQSDSQDSASNVEVEAEHADSDIKEVKKKIEEHKELSSKKEKKSKDIPDKKESKAKELKETKVKSKENKGGRGRSKKTNTDEDMQPAKKRKRIVVMSDSESEDEIFGKEEEEDENISYSPQPQQEQQPESDEEVIPPTPEATSKKGRKRVRKLVDKTFMDEDGYLLTKKEFVFESCSESEPEEEKEKENKTKENDEVKPAERSPKGDGKEPPPKKPKKKVASPQKVKQASIMNFFKKK